LVAPGIGGHGGIEGIAGTALERPEGFLDLIKY
jgi:hypothetical protein